MDNQYVRELNGKMVLFPMKSHTIPYISQAKGLRVNKGEVNCVSLQHDKQLGCEGADFRAS